MTKARGRPKRSSPLVEVLIVDDHLMFAEALRVALDVEEGIRASAASGTLEGVDELAERARPHVVLVDLDLPGSDPIDAIRILAGRDSGPTVIVLVDGQSDVVVARAVEAGAAGYLSKFEPVASVAAAVRAAAAGHDLLGPAERRRLLGRLRHRRAEQATAQQRADRLTRREVEILQHMAEGHSLGDIAVSLGISPATARTHVQNIITKLGVHSKTQALAFAIRYGKVAARA